MCAVARASKGMPMTKGKSGAGLHGSDKQEARLRDVRDSTYDRAGSSRAPVAGASRRTRHQQVQAGADVRQGTPGESAHAVPEARSSLRACDGSRKARTIKVQAAPGSRLAAEAKKRPGYSGMLYNLPYATACA